MCLLQYYFSVHITEKINAKIAWAFRLNKEELMLKKRLEKTALLCNSDGSIYHLNLLPGDLATTIILVGDPDRVRKVSQHFDHIEVQKQKREFVTHTGMCKGQRISVVSTGIGTDNVDIVINECDAVHNVNFDQACVKDTITSLRFLRLGTCGGIGDQADVDRLVLSKFAIGLDGLMSFYDYRQTKEENDLLSLIQKNFQLLPAFRNAYVAQSHANFSQRFEEQCVHGITMTCPGFYGPQYRTLRSPLIDENILNLAHQFTSMYGAITNVEMETAGIYALSNLLGHEACSVSLVLDNPIKGTVSQRIEASIDHMVETMLSLM